MKVCTGCKIEKELDKFAQNKQSKDGFNYKCKSCIGEYYKNNLHIREEYNLKNKDKIQNYHKINKDSKKKYDNEYNLLNKEKIQDYINNNKEKLLEYQKEYNSRQEVKERKNLYNKIRRESDVQYKLKDIFRTRLHCVLKKFKTKKSDFSIKLIGCSVNNYEIYLNSKFFKEMNWDNYGTVWEIDHIKPCSLFDLTDPEQQKICFHYTNTQPLFKTTKIAESFGYKDQIGNRNKSKKWIKN